jgi:hypothetical protein
MGLLKTMKLWIGQSQASRPVHLIETNGVFVATSIKLVAAATTSCIVQGRTVGKAAQG